MFRPWLLLVLVGFPSWLSTATSTNTGAAAATTKSKSKPWGLGYTTTYWNSICRYQAFDVPAFDFFSGQDLSLDTYFPLETKDVIDKYPYPLQACFGPTEKYNETLIASRRKLPCRYKYNKKFNIDYWEDQPCLPTLNTNCYCYALGKYKGGFCVPGGKANEQRSSWTCDVVRKGIIADGGRLVSYKTVTTKPPRGTHYIAAGVTDATSPVGSDFHLWRLDSNRIWSWKAGFTFARNTYKDGRPVRDIRDKNIRKKHPVFCGFFDVNAKTHRLYSTGTSNSELPGRIKAWKQNKFKTKVTVLKSAPKGWYGLYYDTYVRQGLGDEGYPPQSTASQRPKFYQPNKQAWVSVLTNQKKSTKGRQRRG